MSVENYKDNLYELRMFLNIRLLEQKRFIPFGFDKLKDITDENMPCWYESLAKMEECVAEMRKLLSQLYELRMCIDMLPLIEDNDKENSK